MRLPETRQQVLDNMLTYDDAIRNLDRYTGSVRDSLKATLSRTQAWLFIRHNGRWIAAPTKWSGGGINMTPQKYDSNRRGGISGSQASGRVSEIFSDGEAWDTEVTDDNHPAVVQIRGIAQSYGGDLRADTTYWLVPGETLEDNERSKVELLLGRINAAQLSKEARETLIARIAA